MLGIWFALSLFLAHFLYKEALYCHVPIPKGAVLGELPRPGMLSCRRVRAGALLCDPPPGLQAAAGGDEKNVHCQASWVPVLVNVLYTKPRFLDCHLADRGLLLCEPADVQEETARRNAKEWQERKDKAERERYEKCQRGGSPAQKKEAPDIVTGGDC